MRVYQRWICYGDTLIPRVLSAGMLLLDIAGSHFLVLVFCFFCFFFFSSRRRHTRLQGDWSSDVCSSDLHAPAFVAHLLGAARGDVPRGEVAVARVQPLKVVVALVVRDLVGTPRVALEIGRASCRERV